MGNVLDLPNIIALAGVIVAAAGVLATIWVARRHKPPSPEEIAKAAHAKLEEATKREPTLNDPLISNAQGYQWTEAPQADGACLFKADGYSVATLDQTYRFYLGRSDSFRVSNLVLQVQMKITRGTEGGLVFRWRKTASADEFYYFYLTTNGSYGLLRGEDTKMPEKHQAVHQSSSQAIRRGAFQENTLTAMASGRTIDLFANEVFLAHLPKSIPDAGSLGFASGPLSEAVFSQAKMWEL